jgi:tRNA(Ile)-lysidine synthase
VAAVTAALRDLDDGGCVIVACSGGPDSLALLAAATAGGGVAQRLAVVAVVVDHGLQPGSAAVARRAADECRRLGAQSVRVVAVPDGGGHPGGPEARARAVRYEALDAVAADLTAGAVLLGHTADDQAETVLLGLARGGGARALAGMPERRGIYRRPFLALPRSTVRSAFGELAAWRDPHNADTRYARARVRHAVLPLLEHELGPGVAAALARSAAAVREETAAVDVWAERVIEEHVRRHAGQVRVEGVADLAQLPRAVVVRVMVRAADLAGAVVSRLTEVHVRGLVDLVARWRGQGGVDLPGAVQARRISGTVVLAPPVIGS